MATDPLDFHALAHDNAARLTAVEAKVSHNVQRVSILETVVEQMAPRVEVMEAVSRMELQLEKLANAIAVATERSERDRTQLAQQTERDRVEFGKQITAITAEVGKGWARISAINEENMRIQAQQVQEKREHENEKHALEIEKMRQEVQERDRRLAEAAAQRESARFSNRVKLWGSVAGGMAAILAVAATLYAFLIQYILPVIQQAKP